LKIKLSIELGLDLGSCYNVCFG